ncbi:hypothetical protein [Ferrimonas marina]|uniref:Outer membrane protein beta-barrel domain-containing protein n=1 Tax=Ferrimonas marina TaxID=299255 RepID=A0A1M5N713_9GAMM|nr:hypothetical protein [Ferrimonas marina]SHG84803.1 hypothetical protein SAMN02745129_0904 [Ferrimonas marina]
MKKFLLIGALAATPVLAEDTAPETSYWHPADTAITFNLNSFDGANSYGLGVYGLNGEGRFSSAVQMDYYSDSGNDFGVGWSERFLRTHFGFTYGITDDFYLMPMLGLTSATVEIDRWGSDGDNSLSYTVAGLYKMDRLAVKIGVGNASFFDANETALEFGFGFTF